MTISIDAEKAFDKLQYPFMTLKNSQQNAYRGTLPQLVNGYIRQAHSQYTQR